MKTYFVYIMANKSRTLYTGLTNNLERRVLQHQHKQVPGFTVRYNIDRRVYFEVYDEILAAINRERQIKSWGRMKKLALIESMNRDWKNPSAPGVRLIPLSVDRRVKKEPERDSSPSLRSGSE